MKTPNIALLLLLLLFLLNTSLFSQSAVNIQPAVGIQSVIDIDADNDGLIEINTLEDLNAMRYQLDGSGYRASATAKKITTGCAVGGCKGYELTRDLNFNDVASYKNSSNLKLWTTDAGWQPIGDATNPFNAIFKTNNVATPYTIFNLKISRTSDTQVGLFAHTGSDAEISGIGLLNIQIAGGEQVGGLVGESLGLIRNSYASGTITATGGTVGLLAGISRGVIMNSYADGVVASAAHSVGGLVGANRSSISNSYARGSVIAQSSKVGGLVGDNAQGTISNCYTVSVVSGSEDIGGLVGLSNLGTFINNYVSSKVSGNRYVGGLVGSNIGGVITQSYWDKTHSKLKSSTGGVGLDSSELQAAAGQDQDPNKPYYKWSATDWDFGTDKQYPVLKYAAGKDTNNPACGAEQSQPKCGSLLLGQHASLQSIILLDDIEFTPVFKPNQLNYYLNITTTSKSVRFIPTANNLQSTINISRNATMIDSNLASGTTSSAIALAPNTEITIEISNANQRPAYYRFTVNYLPEIIIADMSMYETVDEGDFIILNTQESADPEGDVLSYRWTQTAGKDLLLDEEAEYPILLLDIPYDYVDADDETAEIGLTVEARDSKATITKAITLTVNKIDNASIPIGTPTLDILVWTAPDINLSLDPDGPGSNLQYQWQSLNSDADTQWTNIEQANEKTHAMSFLTKIGTKYRVLISYTDGQGYQTSEASGVATYTLQLTGLKPQRHHNTQNPSATTSSQSTFNCNRDIKDADIDYDDNGLIEICYLEELDSIRNQMDGTGYKENSTSDKITTGCAIGGCKGYELMRDLDFKDARSYRSGNVNTAWTTATTTGWEPIGIYTNGLTSIFEGNGHTIFNLIIQKPNGSYIGLFGHTSNSKIKNIGLRDVNIKGASIVGGLVGRNFRSTITNSYVTGTVSGDDDVGGLVGYNSHGSDITNSYVTGTVLGDDNVGGLVGFNTIGSNITNSKATGTVSGNWHVGGLIGTNYWSSFITSSKATGTVSGSWHVGGLIGNNNYYSYITNCDTKSDVSGYSRVGGLAGLHARSRIRNSYATGTVSGNISIGGLAGNTYNSFIVNSYAENDVSVKGHSGGGLVGFSSGIIINSYATGAVSGGTFIGGLVGRNHRNSITNSYATGTVSGDVYVGGFASTNNGNITNSYAIGTVSGEESLGGFVASNVGTINKSYWDTKTSGILISDGGTSKTTVELQSPTTAGSTSTDVYYNWSNDNWDFGTNMQYPILKYVEGLNSSSLACRQSTDAVNHLPICGSLLSPILRYGLSDLQLVNGNLYPNFIASKLNYTGTAVSSAITVQLIPTAHKSTGTEIRIEGSNRVLASGEISHKISLDEDGITTIKITVSHSERKDSFTYVLHLSYYHFNRNIDRNRNRLIDIYSLEDLNAIRYQLDGTGYREGESAPKVTVGCPMNKCKGYELRKSLDFDDVASYRNATVNQATWTENVGWQPIGDSSNAFRSTFEGNDNTISNLSINTTANSVGLFGYTEDSKINRIGLLNVSIEGGVGVGALVGENRGQITNSHATGKVIGTKSRVGGLVGINHLEGMIKNSYAYVDVEGDNIVGGLVGSNLGGKIANSYAAGTVKGDNNSIGGLAGNNVGSITNSYAIGNVTGLMSRVGGLVGTNHADTTITNSYAVGLVKGATDVGGLVGENRGTVSSISDSYWDKQTSNQTESDGGTSQTTIVLQSSTATDEIYATWDSDIWDFGNSQQYPRLKYQDDAGNPVCDTSRTPPKCKLLSGQYVRLSNLTFNNRQLTGGFKSNKFKYEEEVDPSAYEIEVTATALDPDSNISIRDNAHPIEFVSGGSTVTAIVTLSIITGDEITITVSKGLINVVYTIKVEYMPGNIDLPNIEQVFVEKNNTTLTIVSTVGPIKEGTLINLKPAVSRKPRILGYEWRQTSPKSSNKPVLERNLIEFLIPENFVAKDQTTQTLEFTFAVQNTKGITERIIPLTIEKFNNGQATIDVKLEGSIATAKFLPDPDGDPTTRSYQWQRQNSNGGWEKAGAANSLIHSIPPGTPHGTQYRMWLSYTDGQGFEKEEVISNSITYIDIDEDDDGLIEIRDLEGLNAIRHQPDGTGYKASSTKTKITTGCATGGCKGYELVRDLDFLMDTSYITPSNKIEWTVDNYEEDKDKGWKPIGKDTKSFKAIFKGNNHTISNLMINRPSKNYIGLFSMITTSTVIDNLNLHRVHIKGSYHVGALVGKNVGGLIRNSSVTGESNTTMNKVVGAGNNVGGLVGTNSHDIISRNIDGRVLNSYATVDVEGGMESHYVGGLVGSNQSLVSNSYATGNVKGYRHIGGLVGDHVSSQIIKSYASGLVTGNSSVGGLIGRKTDATVIPDSYWDTKASGIIRSAGGIGQTTKQLQFPTTATDIYSNWSKDVWDFGTSKQYPALKYNKNTAECLQEDKPTYCGKLLRGQRQGLQSLQLSEGAVLLKEFSNSTYHYTILVAKQLMGKPLTSIRTTAIAAHPETEIRLISSNSSTSAISELSADIKLDSANTTITLVVIREKREVSYTFNIMRLNIGIINSTDTIIFNEGDEVLLKADIKSTGLPDSNKITYQWTSDLLTTIPTTAEINTTISAIYVQAESRYKKATVKLSVVVNVRGKQIESSAEQSLMIYKKDNGTIKASGIKNLSLKDALITAKTLTKAILSTDIDEVNDNPNIIYQWQRKTKQNNWGTIISTTTNIYRVPDDTSNNTKYRALISYTDGQGYTSTTTTKAITYIDIDKDNNGLIEITTAEQLNAIRYRVDGTGYRSTAETTKTTTGCREGGCDGYELKAHIELRGDDNWQPIGNSTNPFNTTFEGNHYTISNLSITTATNYVGLFAATGENAQIRNVGLLNVNIKGNRYVGSLVGFNKGSITDSHAIAKNIEGTTTTTIAVGGLVGFNEGSITDSHVVAENIEGTTQTNIAIGGLVGNNDSGTIIKSHAIVKSIIGGGSNVGGLVGKTVSGAISYSYAKVDSMKIRNLLVCDNESSVGKLIDKLVGNNDANTPTVIRESKMAGGCNSKKLFPTK